MAFWRKLIAVVFFTFVLAIAFPAVQFTVGDREASFDGLDLSDLQVGNFQGEFRFSPSLDFYGGSEVHYREPPVAGPGADLSRESSTAQFAKLIRDSGVQDYEVYGLTNASEEGGNRLVARVPIVDNDLISFNQVLQSQDFALSRFVTFEAPEEESESTDGELDDLTPAEPEGQFIPVTGLDLADASAALTYSAELGGIGLTLEFPRERQEELLVIAASEIKANTQNNEDQLYITAQGQAIAVQGFLVGVNDTRAILTFRTFFGNDNLAAQTLLAKLDQGDSARSLFPTETYVIPGRFDWAFPFLKASLGALAAFGIAIVIARWKLWKTKGIWLLFAEGSLILGSIAILKLSLTPLTLVGLIGFAFALGIWHWHNRALILSRTLSISSDQQAENNRSYTYWIGVFLLLAIIGTNSRIPEINQFTLFASAVFAAGFLVNILYLQLFSIEASSNSDSDKVKQ